MKTFTLVLVLAACGDNQKIAVDAAGGDSPAVDDAGRPLPRAVAVGTDFQTGIVSALDVDGLQLHQNVVAQAASTDPVIRRVGDKLYVINRFGFNAITVIDAHTLTLITQLSTGASSNPQDVAVVGTSLYVPATGTAGVVKLDAGTGAKSTIALDTAVGDPDGTPDCISAYAVGTKVFVACDLLDSSFTPRGVGKVAVIDTTTDSVSTVVSLTYKNPQGFFTQAPASSAFAGDLLIPTVPAFDTYTEGCIERVSTGATPADTCAAGLHNSDLGGFATKAEATADTLWLSVVVDANFATVSGTLRKYDLAAGTLAPAVSPSTETIGDLATCPDGSVVAVDQTMNSNGLRVYSGTTERTTDPISIGLPPVFASGVTCFDAR